MKGRNQRTKNRIQQPRQQAQQQAPADYVKRSGCKYGIDKNGKPYISAWKVENGRMYSLYCRPSSKTSTHQGKDFDWEDWIYSLTIDRVETAIAGKPIGICLFCPTTQKVIIKGMGWVLNPKGGVGGYCGPFGND